MICQYCGNHLSEEEVSCESGFNLEVNESGELTESARLTSKGDCDLCGTLTRRDEYPDNSLELLYNETYSFERKRL